MGAQTIHIKYEKAKVRVGLGKPQKARGFEIWNFDAAH